MQIDFFSLQFQKIRIFWPQSLKNVNTPIFKLYLGLIMLCMPVCFVIMLLLTPITAHVFYKEGSVLQASEQLWKD